MGRTSPHSLHYDISGLTQFTKVDMTIDTTKNVVPAGNFIALDLDETTASLDVIFVQIRLRTRRM